MTRINRTTLIVVIVSVLVLGGGYFILNNTLNKSPKSTTESQPTTSQTTTPATNVPPTTATKSTNEQLLYLIEEEKLAHDVYTVMYQKYGSNVFGNIIQSESTHEARVLVLLQARNIPDPRSTELGVFKNQELQTFYNQLIEQGNKNLTEAYKVGVTIEEKDIADINTQLATASDQDVIALLESLRSGSENHLQAFNKQL